MTKDIALTRGMVALVDDRDFDCLSKFSWYAMPGRNTFYALRNELKTEYGAGKRTRVCMHRQILAANTAVVDHIDGNGLNNQRANLRECTHAENCRNRINKKNAAATSKFKGVFWNNQRQKWQARLKLNYRLVHIGFFDSEEDAAFAYNTKAAELFGIYCRPNSLSVVG